ncbi:MAG: D-alanine--D-alanine ligase [Candidatus Omnitrophota bacterium]
MNKNNQSLKQKFGRIGVLMGGDSSEREISLKSGEAVYNSLKENGMDVVAIDIKNTADKTRLKDEILREKIDVAFIALHGVFGEDGQIQAFLEELEIPYTGSDTAASGLAMDKIASKKIFESNGILSPKFIVAAEPDFNCNTLRFPVVVKPCDGGSSIGLSIVKNEKDFKDAFLFAAKYSDRIILEEYQQGKEITVGILDDKPLPVVMIKPKEEFYNYKAKYSKGLTEYLVPAPLDFKTTKLCQETALKAHRALGLSCFSRIDMILKDDKTPVVLEANSIPGMTTLSLLPKAALEGGLSFCELCIKIIESALDKKSILLKK